MKSVFYFATFCIACFLSLGVVTSAFGQGEYGYSYYEEAHPLEGSYQGTITLNKKAYRFSLVIESVVNNKVYGYNIAAGNKREVVGFWALEGNVYVLTLNEPGDKNSDGRFAIRLNKHSATVYSGAGKWVSYRTAAEAQVALGE